MKILALEQPSASTAAEDFKYLAEAEARKVWDLQQNEIIRECYFTRDSHTAVLVLESESIDEAREILSTLPFVNAGLIRFELIPLKPYPGFERLFHSYSKESQKSDGINP
jgi:hypothetical protein